MAYDRHTPATPPDEEGGPRVPLALRSVGDLCRNIALGVCFFGFVSCIRENVFFLCVCAFTPSPTAKGGGVGGALLLLSHKKRPVHWGGGMHWFLTGLLSLKPN